MPLCNCSIGSKKDEDRQSEEADSTSLEQASIELEDLLNGSYACRYTVHTSGVWQLVVTCEGKSVAKSPYLVSEYSLSQAELTTRLTQLLCCNSPDDLLIDASMRFMFL